MIRKKRYSISPADLCQFDLFSFKTELVRKALGKIHEIRTIKNERLLQARYSGYKQTFRRGTLMKMLQGSAQTLPLWVGKVDEKAPPLCGAIPAEPSYVAKVSCIVSHTPLRAIFFPSLAIKLPR